MSKSRGALQIIRFDGRAFQLSSSERFITTLFVSIILHATFVLGTYIKVPDQRQFRNNQNSLDVVLVNSKSRDRPRDPNVLAQSNLDGGGNTDEKRRAKSPLPTLNDKVTELEENLAEIMETAKLPTRENAKIISSPRSNQSIEAQSSPSPNTTEGDNNQSISAYSNPLQSNLVHQVLQRARQIASLEAQISKDYQAYQERPKRKFVGARAAEYRFAEYVEDWRAIIEKIGNDNYPEAARRLKLYGSLLISVAIRTDGSLENIEILHSSGNKILDAAAIHIVELAAPYPQFPQELRRDADVLHITRTWSFTKSDELVSE
jgi:periplasmic protein TonB